MLEELRRTNVIVNGRRRRLIDEFDLITGVSGGSFTALSYALYGDRLYSQYEPRFLTRDVQGALVARARNPLYWPKYIGGRAGRSELAADYYDEILFEGATEAQAQASVPKVDLYVLDVSFDAIPDREEREYYMNLPTSFVLPDEAVDRLRDVAGRLLRQSAEYELISRKLSGRPPKSTGSGRSKRPSRCAARTCVTVTGSRGGSSKEIHSSVCRWATCWGRP